MEQTTDVDTLEVKYAFSRGQLVLAALLAVALGFVGAIGGTMYTRHSAQHWAAEQFQQRQEALNQQVIQAINQLSQRGAAAPSPPATP